MKRIHRKEFLTLSVGAASALAFGCSAEDPGTTPGTGGSGGSAAGTGGSGGSAAGTGGTTGGTGGTTGGSGGTTGGTGGTTGGSGGTAGGSGGTTGGTGGATGGSGGSGGAPVTPNCSTQLKVFITANHMHTMMVTADDVMNGVEKIYDTTGGSDHPHWIKLTAADFTKLKTGGTVRKLACNHEHEHEYIINCVGNALPDQASGVANYCDTNQPHTCGATNTDFCPELPDKP